MGDCKGGNPFAGTRLLPAFQGFGGSATDKLFVYARRRRAGVYTNNMLAHPLRVVNAGVIAEPRKAAEQQSENAAGRRAVSVCGWKRSFRQAV